MSWGIKIATLYLGFVGLIITLVVISMNQKVDLVSKDYYAQEINFQQKIDATKNANAAKGQIMIKTNNEYVVFEYDPSLMSKDLKGEINFFRPSDAEKDMKVQMNPDIDGMQTVPINKMSHGMYKVQMSWSSGGKNYFHEDVVFIK
ncbi:MAG: FixH family protein [Bacteroidia bacterium]